MRTIPPVPDSSTHNRPSRQRGEWGIDRPRARNSPDATSMMQPPCGLSARQPSRTSRHHRDPVQAINHGVSALRAKADIPPQGRDFRV